MQKKDDHNLQYTVPALAALAFLSTVMDEGPIADMIPDTLSSTSTFTMGLDM
jgi:hypothetical protein